MTSKLTKPPRKKLQSQNPDIVIVIGSGKNRQEFECYSQILCYSCPYFDTILKETFFGIYHYRSLFTLKPQELESKRVENVMKIFDFI